MKLDLTIITPERRLQLDDLGQVLFQTPQGEVGLLPGHAALITRSECGIIRAFSMLGDPRRPPRCFVTNSGFLRAIDDHITLLIQHVRTEDEIDAEAAQAEIDEAHVMLTTLDPVLDEVDHTYWSRTIDFNMAVLRLAAEIDARHGFIYTD